MEIRNEAMGNVAMYVGFLIGLSILFEDTGNFKEAFAIVLGGLLIVAGTIIKRSK